MEKELRFHLATRTEEYLASGLNLADAEARAKQDFGSLDLAKEECREQKPLEQFGDFLRDTGYALRSLARTPGFAITAVATLALGIGANTAVFSLIHAVLLRSLPYPQSDQLLRVGGGGSQNDVTMGQLEFWKRNAHSFASVAGYRGGGYQSAVCEGRQSWVPTLFITTDFFQTLGIKLAQGRELMPQETHPSGPHAVVISYPLSQSLGGSTDLLNRFITIGNANYEVVGILPASFWFSQSADVYLPLLSSGTATDQGTNTSMLARLKPGLQYSQAESEMALLGSAFRRSVQTASNDFDSLTITPFHTWLTGDVRPKLVMLFGAVGLLLVIVTLNIASLVLARLASRGREIAIRRALGSSTTRLFRQFAIESLVVSFAGGVLGVACGKLLLSFLLNQIPFQLPSATPIRLNLPVLLFTFAIALFAGLLFTVGPLVASMRSDVFNTLRTSGLAAHSSGTRQYARSLLIIGQVAFSASLLVAAALLIQSLYRLNQEALGFSPQGVLTFVTPPRPQRAENASELILFEDALAAKLASLPGVQSAAAVNVLPLTDQNNFPAQRLGHPDQSIGGMEIRLVTPGYFDAMRIATLAGRTFRGADTASSAPVILVNETVARKWWGDSSPLGDQIIVGRFQGQEYMHDSPRQVIGVVADTKTVYLKAPPRPTIYLPIEQTRWATWGMSWVVRSDNITRTARNLRQAVAEVDPLQPVSNIRSMEEIVSASTAESRFNAWLFGCFAALALLLTAVGLYGLLSFSVARRINEIGTRLALGADPSQISTLVVRQGIQLIVVGLMLGSAGAFVLTRYISKLLFGVQPSNPFSYAVVALVLIVVGCLASYLPARRASHVDPLVALRSE